MQTIKLLIYYKLTLKRDFSIESSIEDIMNHSNDILCEDLGILVKSWKMQSVLSQKHKYF